MPSNANNNKRNDDNKQNINDGKIQAHISGVLIIEPRVIIANNIQKIGV